MDVRLDPSLRTFQDEVRTWLDEHVVGEFAEWKGRGLTGHEDIPVEWPVGAGATRSADGVLIHGQAAEHAWRRWWWRGRNDGDGYRHR